MNRLNPKGLAVFLSLLLLAMLDPGCNSNLFKSTQAPEITGLDLDRYVTDPGDTVTATVTIKDSKDQTLSYEWTADIGQFIPPLNDSSVKWKAPAVGGVYHLTVKVSNDDKSASKSQAVTVRSFADPDVEILAPVEGSYWVQHSTLSVNARASHENGIARVDLYLNNKLKTTSNGHSNQIYNFTCPLDEPSGPAVVKVSAVANVTNREGMDSVNVFIEGVVLGKSGR